MPFTHRSRPAVAVTVASAAVAFGLTTLDPAHAATRHAAATCPAADEARALIERLVAATGSMADLHRLGDVE